jgi:cytochrome c5
LFISYNLRFQIYCEEISMASPHLFRSIMYAAFAIVILPAMVACSPDDSTAQSGDVELRIKPVARFELSPAPPEPVAEGETAATESTDGAAPASGDGAAETGETTAASEAAPEAAPETASPAAVGRDGAAVYALICHTCHNIGVAGAPKKGDKAAWAPRIASGKEALYTSALKGKGVMAPKGGLSSLSDEEVKRAVDYLVDLSQ